MAGSVNKVILVGNLGKDPEVRTFQNGGRVASFSIATSEVVLVSPVVAACRTEKILGVPPPDPCLRWRSLRCAFFLEWEPGHGLCPCCARRLQPRSRSLATTSVPGRIPEFQTALSSPRSGRVLPKKPTSSQWPIEAKDVLRGDTARVNEAITSIALICARRRVTSLLV